MRLETARHTASLNEHPLWLSIGLLAVLHSHILALFPIREHEERSQTQHRALSGMPIAKINRSTRILLCFCF